MAALDPSPRAAKKRKIAANQSAPIYSRVLRTVKQAVYGKSSSPKISGEVFDREDNGLVKAGQREAGRSKSAGNRDNAGIDVDSRARSNSTLAASGDRNEESQIIPLGKKYGRSADRMDSGNDDEESDEESTELHTPSKRRRKNYKGWAYVEDTNELAQNGVPGDIVATENMVGRVKRGREDLTIDINPDQLKPRPLLYTANGARTGADSVNNSRSGRARRVSTRIERKEDQGTYAKPVAGVGPSRKKGRPEKPPASAALSSHVEDHRSQWHQENVSPDELAQEAAEESEQEKLMRTPTSRSRTNNSRFRYAPMEREPVLVSDILVPATQEETIFDSQSPFDDKAHALQQMLCEDSEALVQLKTHILSGLTGKRRLPLVNVEEEETKVKQLVEQTILAGEGNSMLVIGSRGSGKTSLVETIIGELSSDHREDFHVVRLNGLFHTDDKLALREIWRQLGREMDVENDDLSGRSNYADTLTSLLALLAHPAAEDDETATARSVVFILDEFDLFASHPRQTLLYNLFDVAQSRNAPIAVLGLTTKVNVVDSLEKRVKSRFGQRYVHLSLPKSFNAYQDICLSALSYHPSTHDLLQYNRTDLKKLSKTWNDYSSALFTLPLFQQFLKTLYTTTKSIPAFLNASLIPITTIAPTALPTTQSFTTHTLLPPDSKLSLLPSLSTLALSLLIAAARLDIILDTDVCTFVIAYEEYVSLASKSKQQSSAAGQMAVGAGTRVWSQEVAKGAWEYLAKLELVLPAVGGSRGAGKGEIWRVDVGLEEIGGYLEGDGGRGGLLGRWCREI